ncbi:Glycosyltransferase family I N-terminal domain-containing protein [Desulfonema limicola]|uniref:Glycosyltransferase family I N-terminal domain-containing protein n=1 Tax=Desulfonema limicola TaxID=45656 RepID=A0A975BE69_9BACT|nr:glycosyltransferase [Desulfonema limicola]QTA83529.1 Glycosyltransferase family I N-terminal domain-containing protein [Desulfonema limicola]
MNKFKKLKILHLLSQRPDSTGSGIYIQAMIRESEAWGHENFLVAGVQADHCTETFCLTQDRHFFVNFNAGGLLYNIPGMSDVMPYKSSRFCDLSEKQIEEYENAFSKTLKKAVERFEPDIIHSHHLWIVTSLAKRLFPEIPLITSCHGSDLRQFQNCLHLRKKVLSGCSQIDFVIALSKIQKKEIIRLYDLCSEKIIVAGAGYNDRLFHVSTKPAPYPVQMVYAGKLSNAKGLPWFLRALGTISSPAWQLHLIGSGTGHEKENCLNLAHKLGNRVVIHGPLSQENLAEIMRQSHILVLPSFYEGLPLVILEGLASGCRIAATMLPGTKEILEDFNADFISLIKIPRLRFIDQPYEEDEKLFEENIRDAVLHQINETLRCPQIDLSSVQDKIDSFTWTGIFKKVQDVYYKAASAS